MNRTFQIVVFISIAITVCPSLARPQGYLFTKIADNGTATPNGETFTSFLPPVIDGDSIVFQADGTNGEQGIYRYRHGRIEVVVDTNTFVPGETSRFVRAEAPWIDDDRVVFHGVGGSAWSGVYVASPKGIINIANRNTIPPTGEPPLSSFSHATIDGDVVAFLADARVFRFEHGRLATVASNSFPPNGMAVPFQSPGRPWIDGPATVFVTMGTANRQLYRVTGGVAEIIVGDDTPIPGAGAVYFSPPFHESAVAHADGRTVIAEYNPPHFGVYSASDGSVTRIVDATSIVPGTTTSFTGYGDVAFDGTTVAFLGGRPDTVYSGLYVADESSLKHVVAAGDTLGGYEVRYSPLISKQAVSGNSVVFGVIDTRSQTTLSAVYLAQPTNADGPCLDRLTPLSDAAHLVIITHGWRGDMDWVNDLKGRMEELIRKHQADPGQWQVIAYDWIDQASTASPSTALGNAVDHGTCVGEVLSERGYESVHAIGHSAGSGLINAITDQVSLLSPDTFMHLTFLDAYAPDGWDETYGRNADFSDHYFNRGDSLWLDWTEAQLAHAYNVDVTALDPSPTPLLPWESHSWPHEWYAASAGQPVAGSREFGARLSREAGIAGDLAERYERNALLTLAVPPSGDVNEDNEVAQDDLRVIVSNFANSGVAWQNGDLSGDGAVTIEDLILWRNSWFPQAPSQSVYNVPEPPTKELALAFAGFALVTVAAKARRAGSTRSQHLVTACNQRPRSRERTRWV